MLLDGWMRDYAFTASGKWQMKNTETASSRVNGTRADDVEQTEWEIISNQEKNID